MILPIEMPPYYTYISGPYHGTYGEVYICDYVLLKDKRAIKKIHTFMQAEILINEAIMQYRITNDNVIKIYDPITHNEVKYLPMEYCPRGLVDYLKDKLKIGLIQNSEAIKQITGIYNGLNAAHNEKVIHGDLKPENVRFSQKGIIKIGDFGCAKLVFKDTPLLRGSMNYAAPEVINGEEITINSDYFSFGVLAYLILTGVHPFFPNDQSCLTSPKDLICDNSFSVIPISNYRNDIPVPLINLIMDSLSRDIVLRDNARTGWMKYFAN